MNRSLEWRFAWSFENRTPPISKRSQNIFSGKYDSFPVEKGRHSFRPEGNCTDYEYPKIRHHYHAQ